jgi:hypothetical protein
MNTKSRSFSFDCPDCFLPPSLKFQLLVAGLERGFADALPMATADALANDVFRARRM